MRTGFWGKLHSLGRVLGALVSQLSGNRGVLQVQEPKSALFTRLLYL